MRRVARADPGHPARSQPGHRGSCGRGCSDGRDAHPPDEGSAGMSNAGENDNAPAAPGANPDPAVMGSRQGMFGVSDGGDTSGYGGLVAHVLFPAAAVRPYGGYFDEIADHLERALVLSLIHISEPTRLGMISYAVF